MGGFLKNGINAGVVAGIIWGWMCMALNAVTGIFPFEGTFTHNLVTFSVAGAVFGIVTGGIIMAVGRFIPFRNPLVRAVFVSTSLWILLRVTGSLLSVMEPERYHLLRPEFIQGIALAVILGAILGLFGGRAFSEA